MTGYEGEAFKHHKPITHDAIASRLIGGKDGGFRARAVLEGYVGNEATVGVVVQMLSSGKIEGVRMAKFGKVAPKDINSVDVWPEAEVAKIQFPEFDLSDFGDFNACMSTPYVELDFKILQKHGDGDEARWKSVKKGERENKGYGELSFRLHVRTVDPECIKYVVVAVPCPLAQVTSIYTSEANSRGFPGIRIHEGRGRLITREEPEQRYGLGIEPFYVIIDGKLDDNGEFVTEGVQFPTSMAIKKSVVRVLQSGMVPNWHYKRGQFEDSVKSRKYKTKKPESTWPDVWPENDVDTSVESITEDGGGLPEPRNDLSTNGLGAEEDLMAAVVGEFGGLPAAAYSPIREPGEKTKKKVPARSPSPKQKNPRKRSSSSPSRKTPSQLFPKEERPPMYQDDEKFDALDIDRAAKTCYHHSVEMARKKDKEQKKNSSEKCDDVLKKVSIPAGDDDARDQLNKEARKMLRPAVKEIKAMMDWIPVKRPEIIRNLPLATFGLQDGVSSKSIELCHDLTATLEIKMFSPHNLRSSASSQQHKAFADKDGSLVVEQTDLYEDITSTWDVLSAWSTLDCVWSKLFPQWPVAKIAVRVLLRMKMFVQCGAKAKDVMVQWSNRLLALNSSSAANRVEPVDFDRALRLAGDTCYSAGYEREPPARSSLPPARPQIQQPQQGLKQQQQKPTGARGGTGSGSGRSSQASRGFSGAGGGGGLVKLSNGTVLCKFYQDNRCKWQTSDQCTRITGNWKHLCAAVKTDGSICAGKHSKMDHK